MSTQRFYSSATAARLFPNGATGYGSGGSFDCLGPYAKVVNCPISGTSRRLTCYATDYADTYFSIPACTRVRGKYVKGYFSVNEDGIEFHVMDSHKHLFTPKEMS